MAKKTTKKAAKSNELDGKEFFAAVTLIAAISASRESEYHHQDEQYC